MNLLIFLDLTYNPGKIFKFYSLQGKNFKIFLIFTYNQGKVFLILPITRGAHVYLVSIGSCPPPLKNLVQYCWRYCNPNFEKWKTRKCTRSYVEAGKTHGLFHSISYPTKSFIFCKSLLFFQNKARIANSLYSYKFICVYIISFYANITKIGKRSYHCRFTQSKPHKECHVTV